MLRAGFDIRRTPKPNGKGLGIAGAFLTSVNGDELAVLNQRHPIEPRHQGDGRPATRP